LGIYSTKMGTDQFDDMVLKKTAFFGLENHVPD
jgi:hypothetical protein